MLRKTLKKCVYSRPVTSTSAFIAPVISRSRHIQDPLSSALSAAGWGFFVTTYVIIANWIYEGFVDLWHGTYGIEDDEDDD